MSFRTLPPGAARFGSQLLLALALCACGGAGDADRPGEPADSTAAVQAAAPEPCTPPPTVDPSLLTGSWTVLTNELRRRGARFPDTPLNSATDTVPLCHRCTSVALVIHADTATHCTTPEQMLTGELRIMAAFVLASDFPGDTVPGWTQPINKGDTIYAFASDTFGSATMAYRGGGDRVVTAPDSSWTFYYCKHDHIPAGDTLAQWRPRGTPPGGRAGRGKDGDDGDDGGSYGWMACASGCCQFYTPPPNPTSQTTPGQANPNAPDTVGGGRRRRDPGPIPFWCNPRT